MTKPNRAKCPKCGADLSFDPRADVTQCGSCGTSMQIEQPRWHVWRRRRPETAHLPAIQVNMSGFKNMAALIVVGVLGVLSIAR
jgi:ribosomal protein S27AE